MLVGVCAGVCDRVVLEQGLGLTCERVVDVRELDVEGVLA